jgi:hypothetical protein
LPAAPSQERTVEPPPNFKGVGAMMSRAAVDSIVDAEPL